MWHEDLVQAKDYGFETVEKNVTKRKYWLPALFSFFPTIFQTFSLQGFKNLFFMVWLGIKLRLLQNKKNY